jgi:transcriptional regulator with XRE-family HTH domain
MLTSMGTSGTMLKAARVGAGISIRELAKRAHVAPSTVWRIEAGRLDPTVGMLDRLVRAAGGGDVSAVPTREEAVSLALGRLTAAELLRNPEPSLRKARRRVQQTQSSAGLPEGARRWTSEWAGLLDMPLETVVAVLIDPSQHGYELRQNTPFVGLIPEGQRLEAIRQASKAQRAARSA